MEFQRKPLSLLELCIRTVIDNLRYVSSMDGVEMQLLKRILPHCTLDQLTRIESCTEMDISPATDVLWKTFYQRQFGEDHTNNVVKKMKQSGVNYKWKDLFNAKTEKQKELEEIMIQRLAKKYQAEKAEKQSKQIKLCTKVPPSSKRSFFGGSGPSYLSNSSSSYKSPILKKARMEVNSQAKMQAAIQRNTLARFVTLPYAASHFTRIFPENFRQIISVNKDDLSQWTANKDDNYSPTQFYDNHHQTNWFEQADAKAEHQKILEGDCHGLMLSTPEPAMIAQKSSLLWTSWCYFYHFIKFCVP